MRTATSILCPFFLLVLSILCFPAGADLTFYPFASEEIRINDNRRLQRDGEKTVYGSVTELQLLTEYRRPKWRASVRPITRFYQFTNDDTLNREDYIVDFFANRNFERQEVGINLTLSSVSTLTTELVELGRQVSNTQQNRISVAPYYSFFLTPKIETRLSASFADAEFKDGEDSFLVDFESAGLSGSVTYFWRENWQWFGSISRSYFDTPQIERTTNAWQFLVGSAYALNETTSLSVSAGQSFSDIKQQTQQIEVVPSPLFPNLFILQVVERDAEDSVSGLLVDATLEKQFETSELSIGYSRSIIPTSAGVRQLRDELVVDWDKQFSERIIWKNDFRLLRLSAETEIDEVQTENFYLSTRGIYSLSKFLFLEAGFIHRIVKPGTGGSVDSNQVFLTIRYQGDKFKI